MLFSSKFSNQDQLFNYVKDLEISINRYKIKESQNLEEYEKIAANLEKHENINKRLEDQISNLQNKLSNIPKNV